MTRLNNIWTVLIVLLIGSLFVAALAGVGWAVSGIDRWVDVAEGAGTTAILAAIGIGAIWIWEELL